MIKSNEQIIKDFNDKFVYQAYSISDGETRRIVSQQDYTPLTHENVLDFFLDQRAEDMEEFGKAIGDIHKELHNGQMENAYKMACSILNTITNQK